MVDNAIAQVIPMVATFSLPSVATGSSWAEAWGKLASAAVKARGAASSGNVEIPRLTNREAVAVAQAWRDAVQGLTSQGWPLWYQFESIAYGWDPDHDVLNSTDAQAERLYATDITNELWRATRQLAIDLDKQRPGLPRLELDPDAFTDTLVIGGVRAALVEDGAAPAFAEAVTQGRLVDFVEEAIKGAKGLPKKAADITKGIADKIKARRQERMTDAIKVLAMVAGAYLIYRGARKHGLRGVPARRRRTRRKSYGKA